MKGYEDVRLGQEASSPETISPDMGLLPSEEYSILDAIQQRVLWLCTLMIHHANHVRPNPDDLKVESHQASSASMVSILTPLYFHYLDAGDRVSVKPHASPAYHAIQYLLGILDQHYLRTLRAFNDLQAYPSRTKDPGIWHWNYKKIPKCSAKRKRNRVLLRSSQKVLALVEHQRSTYA
jgi:pyruvate dehydrogenase E1 component